ncbi:peroxisomal membrane protein (Pex16), putative [Bodo saltans]|uniref:Peroxisomal membrane protein PEX16 n=1 Tax=Bodo saltans TaxID=75058 RepID=A0A0S4JKY6_BODSA|nr:peroxisomal membrane protein (Pex16), putative [Bodo saltans]|eukprot:CUG90778.1 peroxisomal membrane protein (Pex16), putative [Bodo saltans]
MSLGPLSTYIEWVRENEARANGIERITRGVALMMANPESLISMEGMWTASKVHGLTNQWILSSKGRSVSNVEVGTWIQQLLQETDALLEIYLRQSVSHKAGWLWVLAAQVLKCVMRSYLQKEKWSTAFTTIRDVITAMISRKGRRLQNQPQRPRPLTSLVIPRVVSPTSNVQRPATWSDIGAFAVDLYVHLRSLLIAATAFRAFPDARGRSVAVYTLPPKVAPSTVESLRKSLSPQWSVWRLVAAVDLVALLTSHVIRRYRIPTVIADEDTAAQSCDGVEAAKTTPEETEDDLRISTIRQLIAMSIFRDPFFSIVLKQSIYKHFVFGRLNRWIPIIGPVIANQVQYMLSMQQHSFLYTLQ